MAQGPVTFSHIPAPDYSTKVQLTQEQLARAASLSVRTVSDLKRWEWLLLRRRTRCGCWPTRCT